MTTLLALDIGGTKVGWGIAWAGDTYEVTERGSIPTDAMRGGADVAARICDLASSLVASRSPAPASSTRRPAISSPPRARCPVGEAHPWAFCFRRQPA